MIIPGDIIHVDKSIETEKHVIRKGEDMIVRSSEKMKTGDIYLKLDATATSMYDPNSKNNMELFTTWETIKDNTTLQKQEVQDLDTEGWFMALMGHNNIFGKIPLLYLIGGAMAFINAAYGNSIAERILMIAFCAAFLFIVVFCYLRQGQSSALIKQMKNMTDVKRLECEELYDNIIGVLESGHFFVKHYSMIYWSLFITMQMLSLLIQ